MTCDLRKIAKAELQPKLLLITASLLVYAPMLPAQSLNPPSGSGHYAIEQGGEMLGEAQYSVAAIPGGYIITSTGHMSLASFSYRFHNVDTIDAGMNLVRDTLSGTVHGAKASGDNIGFQAASDASGRNLTIHISADGKETANTVDRHRNAVLVPDLDPGAYMLMARLAIEQPQTAWVLIPKENGLLVPAAYERQADVRGVLRGATIDVQHATAKLSDQNTITVELYYTPEGKLLEADLNAQNLQVIGDGFKLLDRPAPASPAPSAN